MVSYVKSYDPNSVVNDGERDVIVNTKSMPEWAQGALQNVVTGGKMTGDQAERIMKEWMATSKAFRVNTNWLAMVKQHTSNHEV